ncbi:LysM peptidoglycan-binding domain-containing protein [Patescibacteria group bacterium]|nr:LysM peptidoglycan-binding domain-containing protein [Patescibacteria group bacterium]MCL5409564.1 LysM peptidoglycan-binding domain-containing protein [Patescibacteria group bacterium]
MPRTKKVQSRRAGQTSLETRVSNKKESEMTIGDKLQAELKSNQSYLSLVLGLLIVLVVGILVFNYLKKAPATMGPSQQTTNEEVTPTPVADATPQNLPGKYTVKEGDTLFNIAKYYYNDGWQYPKIADANKLADANVISTGQVLDIPSLPNTNTQANAGGEVVGASTGEVSGTGTGGATNQTIWGEAITGDTYTVQDGDWLSKIAGRAYGDIMAYDKIAQANNISDPNVIEPGMVLKIPR